MQQNSVIIEKLVLEARRHLTLSGVDSVDGFSEQMLKLTVLGSKVQICGENIKITAYNKASGNLTAEGIFTEIKFMGKKTSFVKRLFK